MGCNHETKRLYDALQSKAFRDKKLYIATDGGATKCKGTGAGKRSIETERGIRSLGTERGKGSLGFLITDDEGNPFIRCYGQPAGMNPQSFRSELCAALAALRLLHLYIKFFDEQYGGTMLSQQLNLQIYTDSESMI